MLFKKCIRQAVMAVLLVSVSISNLYAEDVNIPPVLSPGFPMITGENVMIMWMTVPGAVKYNIYQNGKLIGEAPAPPFSTAVPKEVGTYKYTIKGIDKSGAPGPASKEGEVTVVTLSQPKVFAYDFDNQILRISFEPAKGASIYEIYKAEESNGTYKLIGSTNKPEYFDPGIRHDKEHYGKNYFFKIVSKDNFGKSSPDTDVHEVKVFKVKKPAVFKIPDRLVIRSMKEVMFIKPELSFVSDFAFLSDGVSSVCADTVSGKVSLMGGGGRELKVIGEIGDGPYQLSAPFRIAADRKDNIYVLDANKPKIFAYDKSGSLIYAADFHVISEKEILDHKKLDGPVTPKLSALVIFENRIITADKETGVIQIYNQKDGSFIDYLRGNKTGEVLYFGTVNKMLVGERWKLYLARPLENKISVVHNKDGWLSYEIGLSNNMVGAFERINGMALDKDQNLIVADGSNHTVQSFSRKVGRIGNYTYHVGDENARPDGASGNQRPLTEREYSGPIAVDGDGRFWIYVEKDKGFSVRQ